MGRRWQVEMPIKESVGGLPDPPGYPSAKLDSAAPVRARRRHCDARPALTQSEPAARSPRCVCLQDDSTTAGRKRQSVSAAMKQRRSAACRPAFVPPQKAWEFAQSPVKNVFMMAFMMWMSGSGVQIFSMAITFSAIWPPIKAIYTANKAFERFEDPANSVLLPKLAFVLVQLAQLGVGAWKLNSMGLLPTKPSDWAGRSLPAAACLSCEACAALPPDRPAVPVPLTLPAEPHPQRLRPAVRHACPPSLPWLAEPGVHKPVTNPGRICRTKAHPDGRTHA
eukprot:scaffold25_cov287-Prasinococcus_capsulatus_cf.AAC.2